MEKSKNHHYLSNGLTDYHEIWDCDVTHINLHPSARNLKNPNWRCSGHHIENSDQPGSSF